MVNTKKTTVKSVQRKSGQTRTRNASSKRYAVPEECGLLADLLFGLLPDGAESFCAHGWADELREAADWLESLPAETPFDRIELLKSHMWGDEAKALIRAAQRKPAKPKKVA